MVMCWKYFGAIVLKLTLLKSPVTTNAVSGCAVSCSLIFPYCSLSARSVLEQRQKFDNIRKKCWEHEVRCGFRFPSKFIVTMKEKETKTFDSPEVAEAHLRGAVENW